MYRHYGPMDHYGSLFLRWLIPIIIIGLIIFIIYKIFRKDPQEGSNQRLKEDSKNRTDSALKILNERYARGEVDEENYKRMKENLLDD